MRKSRARLLGWLIAFGVIGGIFLTLYCFSPSGLVRIAGWSRTRAGLQRDINELTIDKLLNRGDIARYQDTTHVKRLAVNELQMKPARE